MVQIGALKDHLTIGRERKKQLVRGNRGGPNDARAALAVKGIGHGLIQCGTLEK